MILLRTLLNLDDIGSHLGSPIFSNGGEVSDPVESLGTDANDEELVLLVMEELGATANYGGFFPWCEFAEEDAILHVFAVILEEVEQACSAFVIRYIVSAEEGLATGGFQRTTGHDHAGISPRSQRASKRAWIRRMVRQEQR